MPITAIRTWCFVSMVCLLLAGCTKDERVYIPDNEAPPDVSVSTLKLETYINKCYIGLLGRKPTDTEMTAGVTILRDSSLSSGGRKKLLGTILDNGEFLEKTYLNDGTQLLNNWDTALYSFYIYQLGQLRLDTSNAPYYYLIDSGIVSLQRLVAIPQDLANGRISIKEMHRRMVNNYAYDEINMGAENFVRSIFDHFLLRYPTNAELAQGIEMFDGFESILFLKTGEDRYDLVDIFFDSDAYYEGQVRWAFRRFLFRDAQTEELAYYRNIYRQSNGSQKVLFKELLSINEYAGF